MPSAVLEDLESMVERNERREFYREKGSSLCRLSEITEDERLMR